MTQVESPYRFEQTDGCSVISLLPELNEAQWADIEKVGNELLARLNSVPSPTFLVDLSALNYMGSAMVALIVRLWKATKERGGDMVVVNRHELVFEVLKLAGLTKLWTIVDSREKGLAELGVSGRVFGGGPQRGPGLIVLGIIGVLGAIAGLWLQLSSGVGVGDKIAKAVEFGFAALGLVAGTMMLVREGTNSRRNLGIFVLVACVGVVLAGILMAPDGNAPAPAPEAAPVIPAVSTPLESGSSTPAPATTPTAETPRKKNPNRSDDDEVTATPAAAPAAPVDPKTAADPKAAETKPAEKSLPEVLKEKGKLQIGGDK